MRVHCFVPAGVGRGTLTVIFPSFTHDVLSFCVSPSVASSGLQADPALQRDPAVLGGADGDRPAAHLLPAGKDKGSARSGACPAKKQTKSFAPVLFVGFVSAAISSLYIVVLASHKHVFSSSKSRNVTADKWCRQFWCRLSYFEFGAVCRVPAFFVQRPFLSLCKESEQAEWFEMVLFVLKLEEICRKEA